MNYQSIKTLLFQLNLNLDLNTISKIQNFINNEIGMNFNQTLENQKYIIYSALAIISEQDKIQTIDHHIVSNGIAIQQIMNHIQGLSIQTYLDFVQNIMKKYRNVDHTLIWKIRNLKLSYRIFKKYKNISKEILNLVGDEYKQLMYDFETLVWVIYIYCKHSSQSYTQLLQQTRLLTIIIQINCELFQIPLKINQLPFLIQKEFNLKIHAQSNLNFIQTKNKIYNILYKIKNLRHRDDQSIQNLLKNDSMRSRFVDDLIRDYQKIKQEITKQYIDEIKFLRLTKVLPPQKINSPDKIFTRSKFSSRKINFDTFQMQSPPEKHKSQTNESQMNIELNFERFKEPILVSPLIKRPGLVQISPIPKKCQHTPISSKLNEDKWINRRIEAFKQSMAAELEFLFEEVSQNYYSDIQELCKNNLRNVIQYYCKDTCLVNTRVNKIYKLFQSFLLSITKSIQRQERCNLIKNQLYIISLLCLVTNIYFFVNSLHCQQIKQFSQRFGIQYLEIFKLINKVGKFDPTMPSNIRLHLLDIQRKILLLYIWQQGVGYEILSKKDKKTYYQKILQERLQKHIYNRIIEIHKAMEIPQSYQQKTKSIVSYILNQKSWFLKKNYIDQIIILSLYSVIKMNINNNMKLQDLFKKYNTLHLSFNSHKFVIYGPNDEEMNLLDFYNKFFTVEIKQAFGNSFINHKFLVSPIKREFDMNITESPIFNRLSNPQSPQNFMKKNSINFDDLSPNQNSYRKKIAKKLNIVVSGSKSIESSEEQHQTPKFTRLQHRFSFGRLEDISTPPGPLKLRRQVSFGLIPPPNNEKQGNEK